MKNAFYPYGLEFYEAGTTTVSKTQPDSFNLGCDLWDKGQHVTVVFRFPQDEEEHTFFAIPPVVVRAQQDDICRVVYDGTSFELKPKEGLIFVNDENIKARLTTGVGDTGPRLTMIPRGELRTKQELKR